MSFYNAKYCACYLCARTVSTVMSVCLLCSDSGTCTNMDFHRNGQSSVVFPQNPFLFRKYFRVLHELQFATVLSIHCSVPQRLDCCHPCRHVHIHDRLDGHCLQLFFYVQDVQSQHIGKTKCDNQTSWCRCTGPVFQVEIRTDITSHIIHSVQCLAIMCVIKQCSWLLSVAFVQYD